MVFRRGFSAIFLLISVCTLFLCPVSAEESVHPLFLWKTANGEADIYLAGSIHVLSLDFYPLPEPYESALAESDLLVLESLAGDSRNAAMEPLIREHGVYLDGTTLKDHVPELIYLKSVMFAAKCGFSEARICLMRPWLAALTFQLLKTARSGYDYSAGMESIIGTRFARTEKRQLESAESQLELIYTLPHEEQVRFLESVLNDQTDIPAVVEEVIDAWKLGDDERIDSMVNDGNREPGSISERIITDRNRNMVRELLRLTDDSRDTWFVLVGAAHMTGEEGLPSLLARSGMDVYRCNSEGSYILLEP